MSLYLYNTLHKRKEEFKPLNPPEVGFYACGPTVYHFAHIGNLRTMIMGDFLKRVLTFNGYETVHIMNITDVGHLTDDGDDGDDKMEKGAAREGKTVWEVAEFYTEAFMKDIDSLNIQHPTRFTKATDHIDEQIGLIKDLEKKGFTYVIDDGVYYDTSKFPTYGKLTNLDIEGLEAGARVNFNSQKRNPTDFALWKFSPKDKQRGMEWESPWGTGFPGWHIECSAMAMSYLGDTIDIHTGGADLAPVHHTNEIAQAEASTGKPFVNFWLHGEMVVQPSGDKMSKSSGEFDTLSKLLEQGYSGLDYRFLTLQTHYRSPLTFSLAALDAARAGRDRLNTFLRRIYELIGANIDDSNEKYLSDTEDAFAAAINDDLNLPAAMGVIFDIVKDINSQIDNKALAVAPQSIWNFFMRIDQVLGLDLKDVMNQDTPQEVEDLMARRQLAREQQDWESSDRLREQIRDLGYIVEDSDTGQKVKKA